MKKRFVALLVMAIALCWATSAFAATAIAPKSVDISMDGTQWEVDSSNADFTVYWITYNDYFDQIEVTSSHNWDEQWLTITYYSNGQLKFWEYSVRGYMEPTDLISIIYRNGVIAEVNLLTDNFEIFDEDGNLEYGSWHTSYSWQFDTNQWCMRDGKVGENIPPFNADNYPLIITWIGDDVPSTPSTPTNTLAKADDGKFYYYGADGKVDPTYSNPAFEFEGGKFMIIEGVLNTAANGVVYVSGPDFFFYANGQVQEVSQLAEYNGSWFLLKDGKVDQSYTNLYTYDGAQFLITEGRLRNDFTGVWTQDGVDYTIVNGQVQ